MRSLGLTTRWQLLPRRNGAGQDKRVGGPHRRPATCIVKGAAGTMLRLNERQRTLLAEKACDAGNLAVGALVFGQLLGDQLSATLAATGAALGVTLFVVAVWLMKERRQ